LRRRGVASLLLAVDLDNDGGGAESALFFCTFAETTSAKVVWTSNRWLPHPSRVAPPIAPDQHVVEASSIRTTAGLLARSFRTVSAACPAATATRMAPRIPLRLTSGLSARPADPDRCVQDKASRGRKERTGALGVPVPGRLRQAGCDEESFLEGPAVATPPSRRPTPFALVTGGELSDGRCDLAVAASIDDHGMERVVGELTVARVTAGGAPGTHPDPVEAARDASQRRDDTEWSAVRPPAVALVAELDPPMPVQVDPARVRPLDQDGLHGPACHYFPFLPL